MDGSICCKWVQAFTGNKGACQKVMIKEEVAIDEQTAVEVKRQALKNYDL